jgi:hypothetical protein
MDDHAGRLAQHRQPRQKTISCANSTKAWAPLNEGSNTRHRPSFVPRATGRLRRYDGVKTFSPRKEKKKKRKKSKKCALSGRSPAAAA